MIGQIRLTNLLLKGKKRAFLTVIVIIAIFCIFTMIKKHTPLYDNLQGVCNIDFSKSYFCRQTDFHPLENNIFITKQKISLPVIVTANDDVKGNYKELNRLEKEAKGIWKIISVNPDSIQIEVSKSILNGKYSVIFKKNQKENEKLNYYIILKNDSTYMVCTKEILNFKK